jgi:hypothetical protein
MAAVGALLISSGIALLAAPTPASARNDDHKVTFCHSTSSETNPWIELTTDVHSFYHGHVLAQHTSDIYPAISFTIGHKTVDVAAQGDQAILRNGCQVPEQPELTPIQPGVNFTNPTCTTPGLWAGVNTQGVDYALTSGTVAPGQSVVVTATAKTGYTLTGGQTAFPWTFTTPTGCTTVSPPTAQVNPPKAHVKAKAETKTPTVVHAGLVTTSTDTGAQAGLGLILAGLLLLAGAGGLVLAEGGERKETA